MNWCYLGAVLEHAAPIIAATAPTVIRYGCDLLHCGRLPDRCHSIHGQRVAWTVHRCGRHMLPHLPLHCCASVLGSTGDLFGKDQLSRITRIFPSQVVVGWLFVGCWLVGWLVGWLFVGCLLVG